VNRDRGATEDVQFQLAVPSELVGALSEIQGINVESVKDLPDRVQHELALETVAVVLNDSCEREGSRACLQDDCADDSQVLW
jgi:hypothetical protein